MSWISFIVFFKSEKKCLHSFLQLTLQRGLRGKKRIYWKSFLIPWLVIICISSYLFRSRIKVCGLYGRSFEFQKGMWLICFTLCSSQTQIFLSSSLKPFKIVQKKKRNNKAVLSTTKQLMDIKAEIMLWVLLLRSLGACGKKKVSWEDKGTRRWEKILPLCRSLDPLNGMANCPGYHGYEKVWEHINHKDLGFSFSFTLPPKKKKKETESLRRPFMKLIYEVQYLCGDQGSGSESQESSRKSARRLLLFVGNSLPWKTRIN